MLSIASIPTELIELICSFVTASVYQVSEFSDRVEGWRLKKDCFLSRYLVSLPLIHPRWTPVGQKSLYQYVKLPTADYYEAFQQSLTKFPYNGEYVRAISIQWGCQDFGGPDGYAYKVLGWFHEMEIQHVIRLCPNLESFDPGGWSPVISQEGITALGTIKGIRSIAWRDVEFQQNADAVLRALSSWHKLESLQLFSHVDGKFEPTLQPIFNCIKTLKLHDSGLMRQLPLWSLANLRHLDLVFSIYQEHNFVKVIKVTGAQLTKLTIREFKLPLTNLSLIFTYAQRLEFLGLLISNTQPIAPLDCEDPNQWHSDSLIEFRYEWLDRRLGELSADTGIKSRMRRENFPRLRKLVKIYWDSEGIPHFVNQLNMCIGEHII